jgi:cellulose synthase/poly-beta-1,6-N-acetylglucosamine synthase-like glycosyltransferase
MDLQLLAQGILQNIKKFFVPTGPWGYFYEHSRNTYVPNAFDVLILVPYFTILVILALFGLHRYHIVYLYLKHKKPVPPPTPFVELPRVTIQLPIYNEMYVVERLLQAVTQIEYPRHLLDIQVLDDSTDETVMVCQQEVEKYQVEGYDIHYLHRTNREGFKAGALEEGLKSARGEFVAIFDADFVPYPDFLYKTIHHFTDPQVAVVQTRWGHINREYNKLTQAEAIILDGHFILEHGARFNTGKFFNFNGTAGVWRKTSIADAGGWEHDTLTEDTDLSYRAQMKGWRFVYLPDVVCPAELPVDVNAFKTQQFRWAKGLVQTAIKLLPSIFKAKLPWSIKWEAFFHLAANCSYPLMVFFSLIFLPAMIVRFYQGWFQMLYIDLPLFLSATLSVSVFYLVSQRELFPDKWKRSVRYIPFIMSVGIGLSVSNSRAVFEALAGRKTAFARTPKYAIESAKDQSGKKVRYRGKSGYTPYLELALGVYFVLTVVYALFNENYATVPFLFLFIDGFIYFGFMSLFQHRLAKMGGQKPTH